MMKKIFLSLTLVISLTSMVTTSKAQMLEEGSTIFDLYYGVRLIKKGIAMSAFSDNYPNITSSDGLSYRSFGTMGLRFEHMVSERTGLGFEANYENYSVTARDDSSGHLFTGTASTFRLMPRLSFHLGSGDNFDSYFAVAVGYKKKMNIVTSTDPFIPGRREEGIFPLSVRLAFGGRYFLNENLGFNLEIGVGGGALIHTGLTYLIF